MLKARFCIYFGFLLSSVFFYGQDHINFKPVNPTLNNNPVFVYKTIQEKRGNIWMATSDGVLIYDGYDYKLITNQNIFKQKEQRLRDFVVDGNKDIWLISTKGLLAKFIAENGVFEAYNSKINNHLVRSLLVKNNNLWLATQSGTVLKLPQFKSDSLTNFPNINIKNAVIRDLALTPSYLYISTKDGKVFQYNLALKTTEILAGDYLNYPGEIILATDKANKLWIGTETYGVFVYDPVTQQFIQEALFNHDNKYRIDKEIFLSLYCDSEGFMWGGTDGGGLYKINVETGAITLFFKQDANKFSLGSNTILNVNEDNHKNLWVCTNYGNLSVVPNVDNNIFYHEGSANRTPQRVLSVYKSALNTLWIGTDGSGLTKVDFHSDGTSTETQFFNKEAFNKGFYIQSIAEDHLNNIWIGTYRNGLWHYDTKRRIFTEIMLQNSKNQLATDVRSLFVDSKNRIWVGSDLAVSIYNPQLKLLATFDNNTKGLQGQITESIIEDQRGQIWLGLSGGLFKFIEHPSHLTKASFFNFSVYNNEETLDVSNIKFIALGAPGELWVLNGYGRLIKFNSVTQKFKALQQVKAINEVNLAAVLPESQNSLWLSSNNGIYNLNTNTLDVTAYYSADGLQDNMFLSRSAYQDQEGVLYFGGINGLNYFNPNTIEKTKIEPSLYINTIEVLNQPIEALMPEYSSLGVSGINTLELAQNQSSFSFKFSVVDNVLDPKYHYAYRLKGFDDDWIISDQGRQATYTNIPYGRYTFQVKAGTAKNNWNVGTQAIKVHIAPPFWFSPLAFVLYALVLGIVIYALWVWYLLRRKLLLEKLNFKKENELHNLKMNFFTKMSHEIQTPITLILGPIEDMMSRAEESGNRLLNQRLKIIANNSRRLSKIARSLTLLRNKELDKLTLNATKNNLYEHVEDIALSFKELARQKKIDFAINCPKNLKDAWYDKEKIEHVVYNLLSNAFKFTPKEGNVQLTVTPFDNKRQIKLTVSDSGSGIPQEDLNLIFELFYQAKQGKHQGSGIGLALTKELVDLHRGTIAVESSAVSGTLFTLTLPIAEDCYAESERVVTDGLEAPEAALIDKSAEVAQAKTQAVDYRKKTILIVEDNYELQGFLKELLVETYNIILAENGAEGFHYAKSNVPDLILTDIMMPKLDGIEMCMMLQEDVLTQHIPVIILTAKNSTSAKLSGLQSGAIEYINKPFNTNELLLKIKNIISSKEHIISKYKKEVITRPDLIVEKSQDEIFLENMTTIINAKLNDSHFKIEDLADSLNMSHSTLYRKCQALTGKSLVDYIKEIRLKKAILLATKYNYSISEAAFTAGYSNPKYFSKCVKDEYGKSPKEVIKEAAKMGMPSFLQKYKLDN